MNDDVVADLRSRSGRKWVGWARPVRGHAHPTALPQGQGGAAGAYEPAPP